MQSAAGGLGRPSILNALHVGAASQDQPRVESVPGPLKPPIKLILPPTRIAPKERVSVLALGDFSICVPCISHERTARDFEGRG
jgi:hypothetical protein